MQFEAYPKIPRAEKVSCWITEKIDGTNGQILFDDQTTEVRAGSRNRWCEVTGNARDDNFGFGRWVAENRDLLKRLGPGRHFGEWWGEGIGRRYGLTERRFWLFDRSRFAPEDIAERGLDKIGVGVVPMLATCSIADLASTMAWVDAKLMAEGSTAVPGWMQPEGYVVVFAGGMKFKVTDNGNKGKWQAQNEVPVNAG